MKRLSPIIFAGLFTIASLTATAGITRTDVSNLYGFRNNENAESRSTSGSLWIPTTSDIFENSYTHYDAYDANISFHYTNWGQSSASASTESRKLATSNLAPDFRASTETSVRITVSDDLFFTRPNDPDNTELIPVTLKFDIGFSNGNIGYPEKPGRLTIGGDAPSPGYVTLFGLAGENDGENIFDGSFGSKTFVWNYLYRTGVTGVDDIDYGFGLNEAQLLVAPGREITLAHKLEIEHSLGYILTDPMTGDSLNAGGGGRAHLRVWIEVADDIALETDSGHDYREEPSVIQSAADVWGGYPLVDGEWINTGDFLGWLNVTNTPWAYSLTLDTWLYLPEESLLNENGLWTYMLN